MMDKATLETILRHLKGIVAALEKEKEPTFVDVAKQLDHNTNVKIARILRQ